MDVSISARHVTITPRLEEVIHDKIGGLDRFLQGADHLGVGMAADGWPPAADVVDVFVAIHVPRIGALDAIEHDRLSAHGLERTHRRADSTGHQALGFAEDGLGAAGVQHGSCHGNRRQEADANRATS